MLSMKSSVTKKFSTVQHSKEAFNHFATEVLRTLDEIAPQKMVKAANRKPKPWYDEDLKQQRTIMKNREHKWIKYHEDHLWKAYTRERN